MHPIITSAQNAKIKNILTLEKARERRKQNLFIIEGVKELTLAVEGGYTITSVFFCPDLIEPATLLTIVKRENLIIPVHASIFKKLAYREGTGGIIAIAEQKKHSLTNITLSSSPLVLIIEGVEKPGNLGALLRTADAAGMDAVIICDPNTDFYNPNVIRSSVGCVFTNQTAASTTEETLQWLKGKGLNILCTDLQASKPYHRVDFTQPCAIVMGTESSGLTEKWTDESTQNIIIPMSGKIDSMNVSTAAAVVIFEAKRQRGFKK